MPDILALDEAAIRALVSRVTVIDQCGLGGYDAAMAETVLDRYAQQQ